MALKILLVEDHQPDVMVVLRALKTLLTKHDLVVLDDGEYVLPYLQAEGQFSGRVLPDIILLDLNLPRVQGYEVLREVKASPYSRIPMLVLSGSESKHDVSCCYSLGAAAYLVKPGSPETAKSLLEAVERIWFTLGRTP